MLFVQQQEKQKGAADPPELLPWAKAAAAAGESRSHAAGARSAVTLCFVSPRLEAEFAVQHAAFLARWVRSGRMFSRAQPALLS